MFMLDKIKLKQSYLLLAVISITFIGTSCKTCKCPAYSETLPINEHKPQIQTTEFADLQPIENAYFILECKAGSDSPF